MPTAVLDAAVGAGSGSWSSQPVGRGMRGSLGSSLQLPAQPDGGGQTDSTGLFRKAVSLSARKRSRDIFLIMFARKRAPQGNYATLRSGEGWERGRKGWRGAPGCTPLPSAPASAAAAPEVPQMSSGTAASEGLLAASSLSTQTKMHIFVTQAI